MDKKEERLNQILQATIDILSKEGAEQLSMRKVAKTAKLSLSNLQYYYADKNMLLTATTKYYFESCQQEITQALEALNVQSEQSLETYIEKLLSMLLSHDKSDTYIIMFHELWALSSRNKELEKAVETYYKNYCLWMVDLISSFSKQPEIVVSLLLPYLEGYTIVSPVLPLNKENIIQMLVKVIVNMPK